ncbi:MAG TPA: hypothetical protein VLX58_09425 [Bryobacteraceae bacterium]|nr:hypothetical protein [Bryobacteraceae bacterium]
MEKKLYGREKRLTGVRYWSYLAGKLAISGALGYGLLLVINSFWSSPLLLYHVRRSRFGLDLAYTSAVGLWFLVCCGLLYICIWDQRHRCRVCLRRLRMPIETGSWSRMLLLGRPRIEYICPYGHGTLKEEEVHLSGKENPEWTESGDPWEELCASLKDNEPRP